MDKADRAGETPLFKASRYSRLKVAELLLQAGADKSKANYAGMTPLSLAISKDHADIVQLLLDAGAEMDNAESNV